MLYNDWDYVGDDKGVGQSYKDLAQSVDVGGTVSLISSWSVQSAAPPRASACVRVRVRRCVSRAGTTSTSCAGCAHSFVGCRRAACGVIWISHAVHEWWGRAHADPARTRDLT